MCVAMLIGTTFAWFTDTASTAVNKIQSGKLDVALEMSTDGTNWESAEGKTLTFNNTETC
jgi:predicted ribosomally synthesized peptide with SipW-like signal peptide